MMRGRLNLTALLPGFLCRPAEVLPLFQVFAAVVTSSVLPAIRYNLGVAF